MVNCIVTSNGSFFTSFRGVYSDKEQNNTAKMLLFTTRDHFKRCDFFKHVYLKTHLAAWVDMRQMAL